MTTAILRGVLALALVVAQCAASAEVRIVPLGATGDKEFPEWRLDASGFNEALEGYTLGVQMFASVPGTIWYVVYVDEQGPTYWRYLTCWYSPEVAKTLGLDRAIAISKFGASLAPVTVDTSSGDCTTGGSREVDGETEDYVFTGTVTVQGTWSDPWFTSQTTSTSQTTDWVAGGKSLVTEKTIDGSYVFGGGVSINGTFHPFHFVDEPWNYEPPYSFGYFLKQETLLPLTK